MFKKVIFVGTLVSIGSAIATNIVSTIYTIKVANAQMRNAEIELRQRLEQDNLVKFKRV